MWYTEESRVCQSEYHVPSLLPHGMKSVQQGYPIKNMSYIHHQRHKNDLDKRNTRHEKIHCQILSRACVHQKAHQHGPQKIIPFLRVHHAEGDPDKQIPCHYRYRIRERLPKCMSVSCHTSCVLFIFLVSYPVRPLAVPPYSPLCCPAEAASRSARASARMASDATAWS